MKKQKEEIITEVEETDALTALSFKAWDLENINLEEENVIWEMHYQKLKSEEDIN